MGSIAAVLLLPSRSQITKSHQTPLLPTPECAAGAGGSACRGAGGATWDGPCPEAAAPTNSLTAKQPWEVQLNRFLKGFEARCGGLISLH